MQEVYEWLVAYGWVVWLVLFLGLAAIETLTLDLFFAMLSAGALAAMLAAILSAPLFLQVVVFSVVALLMIVLVRPVALKHLNMGTRDQRSNIDRLIGEAAVTLEPVGSRTGTVKIGGDTWTARSGDGSLLPAGEQVSVTRIEGATAVVEPLRPAGGSEAAGPFGQDDGLTGR
ncbi:NfeD family protein [Arthrobacter pullicola]|uniref:NfeD family protein n=1 Tax=Arthrobacter pullicola TaxID=2762224 RepID=UPI001CD90304|nr:NfeD family protein [Arthrobacter pullicola]